MAAANLLALFGKLALQVFKGLFGRINHILNLLRIFIADIDTYHEQQNPEPHGYYPFLL
jgi:hypothetical protein